MFKKFMFIAIFVIGASAQASTGDCNLTNSCPGNPFTPVPAESAFNSANTNNIEGVFTQLASNLTKEDSDTMSGFNVLGPSINGIKTPVPLDDPDSNIEK